MGFLYDAFKNAFGEVDPAVIFFFITITAIFLWVAKEIREQVRNDEEINRQHLEKTLLVLSEILSAGRSYKKEGATENFYNATYGALPYINHKLVSEYLRILKDNKYPESKQVQLIVSLTEEELMSLSTLSKKLKTTSILEDIEKYRVYFTRIFSPFFISISLIALGLLFININNYAENEFWVIANSVLLGLGIFLLILALGLITSKKLTPIGVLFLIGLIIFDFATLFTNGIWSIITILSSFQLYLSFSLPN